MKTYLIAAAALAVLTQAASAESWNCQLPSHAGLWLTDGGDLVGPTGARYPVVRDESDMLVGLSEGPRMEMVVLNRRTLVMQTVFADGSARDTGRCMRPMPGTPAAAAAVAAGSEIRPVIRSLARQAHNLASQGYTTAASLKLIEAQGERRITAEESRLIAQERAYIATKPRR